MNNTQSSTFKNISTEPSSRMKEQRVYNSTTMMENPSADAARRRSKFLMRGTPLSPTRRSKENSFVGRVFKITSKTKESRDSLASSITFNEMSTQDLTGFDEETEDELPPLSRGSSMFQDSLPSLPTRRVSNQKSIDTLPAAPGRKGSIYYEH